MESQLDSQRDLQRLLARQSEIQRAMRRPGGIRITVERELYAIREQLKRFPTASHSQGAEVASAGAAAGAGGTGAHAPQP
ncbi:MAG TPA: hypothetical protein VHY19_06345 [Steroidobacteraceae bacterium]|jgi:hypothetical protein|nr:hypothetical protein [Steroidobacteraceae bacterium]